MITPYSPKQFSKSLFSLKGISKKTMEDHLKLYQGYVNKYNEINIKLSKLTSEDYEKSNQVFSTIRSLKTEVSFAWGGIVNHELYFSHLEQGTTSSNKPTDAVLKQIEKDFGSFETYKIDLKASALAARGWVWTIWNTVERRLLNHIGDSQNTYAFWFAVPVVAVDVYEHAYFADFGVNRGLYVDAFLDNINWKTIHIPNLH